MRSPCLRPGGQTWSLGQQGKRANLDTNNDTSNVRNQPFLKKKPKQKQKHTILFYSKIRHLFTIEVIREKGTVAPKNRTQRAFEWT